MCVKINQHLKQKQEEADEKKRNAVANLYKNLKDQLNSKVNKKK